LQQKPDDCTWITYTRCHDDIGLGFDDEAIRDAGFNPYEHRRFLKNYYSGEYQTSVSKGALFAVNPKTQDARISGTLASLCGLEDAINKKDNEQIQLSIQKIILMQAHAIFLGGIPMLFYGDELGYTNDYNFERDPSRSDDNRWMHRPVIDWKKVKLTTKANTIENQIFLSTKRLLDMRKRHDVMADLNNTHWVTTFNKHIAVYIRQKNETKIYCIYNFSKHTTYLTWELFKQNGPWKNTLTDLWSGKTMEVRADYEHFKVEPYEFIILEMK
ncbi:MAG: alpha-glucosidase C-terminal domain-containing protein, partial [Saprospiraceae bacterium]